MIVKTLVMCLVRISTSLIQCLDPKKTSNWLSLSKRLHTDSTSRHFPTLLKTSSWSIGIPFLFPTHHEIIIVWLTFCSDEERGRFQCGWSCSYFWYWGDVRRHRCCFYYPRLGGWVHWLAMTDPNNRISMMMMYGCLHCEWQSIAWLRRWNWLTHPIK